MATVNIPPTGSVYGNLKHRGNRIKETSSLDPVERYRLKEERQSKELQEFGAALATQGKANSKIIINGGL